MKGGVAFSSLVVYDLSKHPLSTLSVTPQKRPQPEAESLENCFREPEFVTVWMKYEKQIVNFGQNSSYQFVTRFFFFILFFLIPDVHNILGSIRVGGVLLE